MTKGKSLRGRHLVITRKANIILIILKRRNYRTLWRRRGRRSIAADASLSAYNASYPSVDLTHLISEIVKMTTKISMHPLRLLHDGIESDTSYERGRSGGRGWNNKSYRIGHLYLWPLQLKLSLTPPDRTNANGTHDGEKRRERNINKEMLKDPHDSQRKDELITGSSVLIHIYDRCDEVRGKVDGKILHQRKKKMTTRFSDGVIVRQWCESERHHHVKESQAFCKTRAWGVELTTPNRRNPIEMGDEFVSRHNPKMITTNVVRMHYPRDT